MGGAKNQSKKLLLIENNENDALLFKDVILSSSLIEFHLEWAQTLKEGLDLLNLHDFDLILLDMSLTDSSGLDTFEQVFKKSPNIPIVILSDLDDENIAIKALQMGAQDYLIKGTHINSTQIIRAIRYAIERQKLQKKIFKTTHELQQYILDLQKANETIKIQQNEIIKKENMKVMLEIAGAVSHEMAQPLQVIMGAAEILLLDTKEEDFNYKTIKTVYDYSQKMSKISSKLRNINQYKTKNYAQGQIIVDIDKSSDS